MSRKFGKSHRGDSDSKSTGGQRDGTSHGAGNKAEPKAKSSSGKHEICMLNYNGNGVLTNLRKFTEDLKIFAGQEFGDLFSFVADGEYPSYELLLPPTIESKKRERLDAIKKSGASEQIKRRSSLRWRQITRICQRRQELLTNGCSTWSGRLRPKASSCRSKRRTETCPSCSGSSWAI